MTEHQSLISALSADGRLAAVALPLTSSSNRLLIQVYQLNPASSSCLLQQTLTHTVTKEKGNLNQLVVQSNKFVIGLVGSKEIVVWDLTRGVVSSSVVATDEHGR